MSVDLTSVLAKLGRAHEHAQAVKDEVRAWRDSNPYMMTREVNSDFTRYSLIAHIGIEPPVQRWSLMVADAINNLRSALDHLLYAIAIYEQVSDLDAERILFPLTESPTKFKNSVNRIEKLSAPVQAAIERCQPYNRTHADLPPPLLILASTDNANKHRLLRVAFASMVKGDIGFVGPVSPSTTVQFSATYGEIKDGTEVIAYTFNRPTPEMKFDRYDFLLVIALWHGKRDPSGPDGSDRTDFPALLTLLAKEVREVIDIVVRAALKL